MPLRHDVREVTLPSGGKGVIVNVPDSTVMSYTIHFRAGNDYVKRPEIHQTAHLMEHMAFGPNAEFPTMEAFSYELSRNGAQANASTANTNMNYYVDSAQLEWERILNLQRLSITQPTFLPDILRAEKGNVREELTGYMHNNGRQLWMQVNRAMGGHSLLDSEKIATIDAVTIDDIREHHERTHTRENMRFVLAGRFEDTADHAIEMLESWQLPRGKRLAPVTDTIAVSPPVALVRHDQENITAVVTIMVPRKLDVAELMLFAALNHLLTGSLHSRIFGKARTRGICYGIGSNTTTDLNGTSSWDFYGQVLPENAEALMALIHEELQRVIEGDISDDDVADAQQYLLGDYQMSGQTVGALAGWYASDYFFDDTIDNIDNAAIHIAAITKDGMIRVAREFIETRIWTLGEVGNTSEHAAAAHHAILKTLFA